MREAQSRGERNIHNAALVEDVATACRAGFTATEWVETDAARSIRHRWLYAAAAFPRESCRSLRCGCGTVLLCPRACSAGVHAERHRLSPRPPRTPSLARGGLSMLLLQLQQLLLLLLQECLLFLRLHTLRQYAIFSSLGSLRRSPQNCRDSA